MGASGTGGEGTTGDTAGTQGTATSSGGPWQGTGTYDPTEGSEGLPCVPPPCPAGTLGCPCGAGGCTEGSCEGTTCTEVVDDMVRVPAGPFCMGCSPGDEACVSHERPEHEVTLSAFAIDRTEVTQGAYEACVETGVCPPVEACGGVYDPVGRSEHPAICITYAMANAYCDWVGKALPTEAQWEKAARGRLRTRYPWGDAIADCDLANLELRDTTPCQGDGEPAPVGSRPAGASPYGALDMAGNVWERVADWFDPFAYQHGPVTDPTGPATGSSRVLRGGAYTSPEEFVRATVRDGAFVPELRGLNVGFRCARPLN